MNDQRRVGDVIRFSHPSPPNCRRVVDMGREEIAKNAQAARVWIGLLATLDHYGVQRVADLSTSAYFEVWESAGIFMDDEAREAQRLTRDDLESMLEHGETAEVAVTNRGAQNGTEDLPVTLRVPQVATLLDVSEWEVRRMITRRELRHVRVGRLIRIPREAIAEFLNGPSEPTA